MMLLQDASHGAGSGSPSKCKLATEENDELARLIERVFDGSRGRLQSRAPVLHEDGAAKRWPRLRPRSLSPAELSESASVSSDSGSACSSVGSFGASSSQGRGWGASSQLSGWSCKSPVLAFDGQDSFNSGPHNSGSQHDGSHGPYTAECACSSQASAPKMAGFSKAPLPQGEPLEIPHAAPISLPNSSEPDCAPSSMFSLANPNSPLRWAFKIADRPRIDRGDSEPLGPEDSPPSFRQLLRPRRSLGTLAEAPRFSLDDASFETYITTASSGWAGGAVNGSAWTSSGAGGQRNGQSGRAGGRQNSGPHQGRGGTGGGSGGAGGSGNGGGGGGGPGHQNGSPTKEPGVQSIFRRLELVGRGAYGAVYRGVHVASGTAVALKVVNLDTPEDDVQDIQHEVATLSQLKEASRHNVVRYWGCWMRGPELWIVMDFAEGGSIRTIMKSGPIPEKLNAVVVRETLVALAYLHRQGIIHRDIKAANVLLTNTGKILLCDFGIAANLQNQNKRSTMIGTPYWMAPEVISKGKLYDQSADIWSLGITVFEMATGNPPLADLDQLAVIQLVPKQTPPRLPADGQHSPLMREFVSTCLNEVAIERPSADELSKSKWLKTYAKVPTTALKELLTRYNSWLKSGGMRTSLLGAGLASLVDPGNRDSFAFDGVESEEGWEFSTLGSQLDAEAEDMEVARMPAPSRNHPLARLFQDEDAADSYTGWAAGFGAMDAPPTPTAPVMPTAASAAPSGDTPTLRKVETTPSATPVKPGPTSSAAAAAAAAKGGFSGTGNAPFRFGGGGGGGSAMALRRPVQPPAEIPRSSRMSPTRGESSTSAASSREDLSNQSGHASSASSATSRSIPTQMRSGRSESSHNRGKSSVSSFSSNYQSPAPSSHSPAFEQGPWQQRPHEPKASSSRRERKDSDTATGRLRTGSAPETPPANVTERYKEEPLPTDELLFSRPPSMHTRQQHGGSDPTLRSSTDASGHLARSWRERSASQVGLDNAPFARSHLSKVMSAAATPPRQLKLARSNLAGVRDRDREGDESEHTHTPGTAASFSTGSTLTPVSTGFATPAGRSRLRLAAASADGSSSEAPAAVALPPPPPPPPPAPLDLDKLGAREAVNAELVKRVDELGRWLDLLGAEISGMLA